MSHIKVFLDFETFWDADYTLTSMSMTDYIQDERFEALSVAFAVEDGSVQCAMGDAIHTALRSLPWEHVELVACNTYFDAYILTHHFGCYPAAMNDIQCMSRLLEGVDVSCSLKALGPRWGVQTKENASAIVNTKGRRLQDFSPAERAHLAQYNIDDVEQTRTLYNKMIPFVPTDELDLIDMSLKMYAMPVLELDAERLEALYADEQEAKRQAMRLANIDDPKELSSSARFCAALKALNVDPPMKFSPKNNRIPALAKNDLGFQSLLDHENPHVRALAEARMAIKSTLIETRAESLMRRSSFRTPIYLRYWGTRTGRWSGGDKINWQNLPKHGRGAELRKSLRAPAGTHLIAADSAQIEARILAWVAGQTNIVEAFAEGNDVYAYNASAIYGRPISKENDPLERFVGKVFTLGAGYGVGATKLNTMLAAGAFGPPIVEPVETTQLNLTKWRQANSAIVRYWTRLMQASRYAFGQQNTIDVGVVTFEGHKGHGYIHLPNGTFIKYNNVTNSPEGMYYESRTGPKSLYGGLLTENVVQALARAIMGYHMLRVPATVVSTIHDEIVMISEHDVSDEIVAVMRTPPPWAEGLPLDVDIYVGQCYGKA